MNSDSTHIDNLIARYLAGEASEKEQEELLLWMENSPENKKYFEGIRFVHDKAIASHTIVKVDVDKAWNKVSAMMDSYGESREVKTVVLPVYKKFWVRIAATIIIFLGISAVLFYYTKGNRISGTYAIASGDSIVEYKLAGLTQLTLNRNTTLSLITRDKEKQLELAGEAFIKVTHSPDTAFVVKAGETFIRDIGTSFNVKAYPDSKTVEVFVEYGEVIFYTSNNAGLSLKAGEYGIYDKARKIFYKPDAVDVNAIAYKSKLFVFRDIPLKQAITALNNVYGYKFELANANLVNCRITVTFDSEEPEAIADIIAETLGLRVSVSNNKYILDGETCSIQP